MTHKHLKTVPAGAIFGWHGASQITGKSEAALKMAYARNKLPLNPQRIGRFLFFDVKELEAFRDGLNENS